jgi:hypothetical protein
MYPNQDLSRLAAHKLALRRDIAIHRAHCVTAAVRVAQPLAWIDRMLAFWRQLAPFAPVAAVPLALLASRTLFPRLRFLAPVLRWAPVVFSVARGLGSVFNSRPRPIPR